MKWERRTKLTYVKMAILTSLLLTFLSNSSRTSSISAKKYLIITATDGYDIIVLTGFMRSLRNVFLGDVIVLISESVEPSTSMKKLAKALHFSYQPVPRLTRHGLRTDRYFGYAIACTDRYAGCFAADVRDVRFQTDPFKDAEYKKDLVLSLEDARVKFGPTSLQKCSKTVQDNCFCPYNHKWIESCWGTTFVESLNELTPICSGTIQGTPAGFIQLHREMEKLLTFTSENNNCTARDQGHLNYLYYSGTLDRNAISVEKRGSGIVNTVGYMTTESVAGIIVGGQIRNDDGQLSPVIHQYDRFPALKKKIDAPN